MNGKTLGKFVAVTFMLLLMMSANVSAQSFWDVNESDWFYEDVELAKQDGIMQGYEDCSFRPYNNVTIAEAQKVIALLLAEKNGDMERLSTDIKIDTLDEMGYLEGHWAKNYNRYLMSNSYTTEMYVYDSYMDRPIDGGHALAYFACMLYNTDYEKINDFLL